MMRHFWGCAVYTVASCAVATVYGGWTGLVVAISLGLLEISLSMDNAVVNAKALSGMSPVWQRRFLVWGMLIAVFGMRLLMPLAVVSASAWISPEAALRMALQQPDAYAQALDAAHIQITGFGGAFLCMLFFEYFIDGEKEVHWIGPVERCMCRVGHVNEIGVACTVLTLLAVSLTLDTDDSIKLMQCGAAGIVAYIMAEGAGELVGGADEAARALAKAGIAGFVYLEIQDASFSFDGVIGALAVSDNLVLIALGLGIGAMFVRSLTILLVEQGTLADLVYLEHGAFWAVGLMAALMFVKLHIDVPDYVTGVAMAGIIGAALVSSLAHTKALVKTTA